MDEKELKNVVEAVLMAAGRPVSLDRLVEIVGRRAGVDRQALKRSVESLEKDYQERGLELQDVASGYRIQIGRSMSDWLTPLWEERAPRYTRALLETLALIAYRQPITRGEIEEVRGVVVSTNIVRTLLERGWVRVVGHRDVPGKPAMFGTTREFLDYFGLNKLEDLPPLSEIKDFESLNVELAFPQESPQTDFVDVLAESGDAEPGSRVSEEEVAAGPPDMADLPDTSSPNGGNEAIPQSPGDDGEEAAPDARRPPEVSAESN